MLIRPIDISSFVNDFLTVPRMLHPGRKFNFLKKPTFLKGFKPRQAALPELHLNAFMPNLCAAWKSMFDARASSGKYWRCTANGPMYNLALWMTLPDSFIGFETARGRARLNRVGWQFFFGASSQNGLFERSAVPEIFVDMCSVWLLPP